MNRARNADHTARTCERFVYSTVKIRFYVMKHGRYIHEVRKGIWALFCFVLFCVLFCCVVLCFVVLCFVLLCFVLFCFVLFLFLFCFVLFLFSRLFISGAD